MSNVDITYLGQIAPEYVGFSDTDRFDVIKGIAESVVSENTFGAQYDYAVALTIAHMLKMGDLKGVSGALTKEKIGDEEYQYASMGSNASFITAYSKELERLKKSLIIKGPLMMDIDRAELNG